jgi:acyl-CoA dehydrogenase
MNFDFTEEEKTLKLQLRRLLKSACPPSCVRSALESNVEATNRLSAQLAELGWFGIAIPEVYGGQGLGHVALCGVAEELGRVLAPTSFGSSIFLVAEALLQFGSDAQREAFLPALASGQRRAAFAIAEKAAPLVPRAVTGEFRDGKLSASKSAVVDGLTADLLLVAARYRGEVRLFLVDTAQPAIRRTAQISLDPTRPLACVALTGALAEPLGGGDGVGWDAVEQLLDRAAILFAFEQLGGADAALEMAREYAMNRYAFGRPIAAFQAIKHKLADVYIANELARGNAYYGAWALSKASPDLDLAAATARVACTEASERAARELLQTHGGISATWQHDCHLYYRRARHLGICVGALPQWRDRLTTALVKHNPQWLAADAR